MMSSLTHKWHRPWPCRRRSEQRRIPSDSMSKVRVKMETKMEVLYRFNLTRVNLNDPDTSGNELFSQALSEAADSGLSGAVNGASGIWFTAYKAQRS